MKKHRLISSFSIPIVIAEPAPRLLARVGPLANLFHERCHSNRMLARRWISVAFQVGTVSLGLMTLLFGGIALGGEADDRALETFFRQYLDQQFHFHPYDATRLG